MSKLKERQNQLVDEPKSRDIDSEPTLLKDPQRNDLGLEEHVVEKPNLDIPIAQNQSPSIKPPNLVKDDADIDWDSWDPMGDDIRSSKNTLALDPNNDPMCQITGQRRTISEKIGHVTICEHFARYGECADGQYCNRAHVDPYLKEKLWAVQNQCELNKNRLCLTYTYLSPIELQPDPEKLVLVSLTNNQRVNDFYMIVPYENLDLSRFSPDDIKFYVDNVTSKSIVKTKLLKIHQDLKSLFDHQYRLDNINDEIYLSQIVACKTDDGYYRRAMVIKTPKSTGSSLYHLLLIDLGIEVQLPREGLFDIKAQYLSEPPIAVNCRLPLKPTKNQVELSDELMFYFEIWTETCQFFLGKIISYSEMDRIFTVDIIHCDSRKSLVDDIVQRGLAESDY